MNDKIHVWITKHALTDGIVETDAILCSDTKSDGSMIRVEQEKEGFQRYYHGNQWHQNYESAKMQALSMRHKAIEAAKRKIAKLERLTF